MLGKGYYDTAQLRVAGQEKHVLKKFSDDGTLILAADFNPNEEDSYDPDEDVELLNNAIGSEDNIYTNNTVFQDHQDGSPIKPSYFTFNGSTSFLGTPKSGGSHEGEDSFSLNMGNDFTLSFWFRLANGVSASSNGIIAGIGSTSSDGLSFSVINYKPECNFEGTKSLSGFSMEVDEWYNIVMVKKNPLFIFI